MQASRNVWRGDCDTELWPTWGGVTMEVPAGLPFCVQPCFNIARFVNLLHQALPYSLYQHKTPASERRRPIVRHHPQGREGQKLFQARRAVPPCFSRKHRLPGTLESIGSRATFNLIHTKKLSPTHRSTCFHLWFSVFAFTLPHHCHNLFHQYTDTRKGSQSTMSNSQQYLASPLTRC